jgi:hypothetical protein
VSRVSLEISVIAAAAAGGQNRATLSRKQMGNNDTGSILVEMEAVRRPEWKDNADHSLTYSLATDDWQL